MSVYRVELPAGCELFREGDAATTAFLIERGQIEISTYRNGEAFVLSRLGPGALLGEMAVIDDSPRTATARALSECVLTPIDRSQFAERLEAADPVVRALLMSQLVRYRTALATLAGTSLADEEIEAASSSAGHALHKIRLENQLREALEQNALEIRLQPIQDIATGHIAGYEALTRWTHPEHGVISPAEFIALAEETSLILPVGVYVLRAVCSALHKIGARDGEPLPYIALNVSGRQLSDASFIDRVIMAAKEHEIEPGRIKLEITESLVLDYEKVRRLITGCHNAGIRVALDDFGTGYSNLGHLHELEFDTLKLDQGFIRQLEQPRCLAIVRAIISLANALGCDIVAEGVESETELAMLKALGCQYAQGYLVGRPMAVAAILEYAR